MSDQYLGEIRMFAGNFAPEGWAFCKGQLLPIKDHEVLYSLIGTTYGGDGQTTFALPDLRGRVPLHFGTDPVYRVSYKLGQRGGQEKVALTLAEMPAHTHTVNASSEPGDTASPSQAFWAASTVPQYSTIGPNLNMDPNAIGVTGNADLESRAHDNMMPYLPVSFIIALVGNYPY